MTTHKINCPSVSPQATASDELQVAVAAELREAVEQAEASIIDFEQVLKAQTIKVVNFTKALDQLELRLEKVERASSRPTCAKNPPKTKKSPSTTAPKKSEVDGNS